jgi:hypothetical protein
MMFPASLIIGFALLMWAAVEILNGSSKAGAALAVFGVGALAVHFAIFLNDRSQRK